MVIVEHGTVTVSQRERGPAVVVSDFKFTGAEADSERAALSALDWAIETMQRQRSALELRLKTKT